MADQKINPRNIPQAVFVEDVDGYMKTRAIEAEFAALEELHQKYKFMEGQFQQKRAMLERKVPDLKNNIEVVEKLKAHQESDDDLTTHFELGDNFYAQARIGQVDTVSLWLGANVMLEYPLDDAEALLRQKYDDAVQSIKDLENDMAFIREQLTTTEVNIARIYNWNVRKGRESQQQSGESQ